MSNVAPSPVSRTITRRRLLGAGGLGGLALATGCMPTATPTPPDAGGGAASGPATGTVVFMAQQGLLAASVFDGFRAAYPDVTLDVQEVPPPAYKQKIRSLTQTQGLADVMILPGGPDGEALVKAGAAHDLSADLDTPAADGTGLWRESFRPGVLDTASQTFLTRDQYADGQQWFVPQSLVSVAAVYNADLFAELGLRPPTTWEEMVATNDELVAAGVTPMTLNGAVTPDWWAKMAWDQTARDVTREQVEAGEMTFTDPRIIEGLAAVADLHRRRHFTTGAMTIGAEEEQQLFLSGKIAQFVNVQVAAAFVEKNATFEVGAFALPGLKGLQPVRPVGGTTANLVVSAASQALPAAVALAKYLTSAPVYESQRDAFLLSPLASEVSGGSELYKVFSEAIAGGSAVPQTWFQSFNPANYDVLNKQVYPDVFSGAISPEDAGAKLTELFGA